jgi:hypothetical protein
VTLIKQVQAMVSAVQEGLGPIDILINNAGMFPRVPFLEMTEREAGQLFGDLIEHWERRSAEALERMHPDKLDRAKLMSRVEKYGYSDIAAALRERGGLPDPEQAYLTGGVENVDDFYVTARPTRKQAEALYPRTGFRDVRGALRKRAQVGLRKREFYRFRSGVNRPPLDPSYRRLRLRRLAGPRSGP